jgi:hypothetical protein
MLLQGLNWLNANVPGVIPLLPSKYAVVVGLGLGVIQSVLALVNHFYNPDGTSAKAAWIPK